MGKIQVLIVKISARNTILPTTDIDAFLGKFCGFAARGYSARPSDCMADFKIAADSRLDAA